MEGEQIMPLSECLDASGPYFSMVLIPGQGRRL
jgi:precorrin-2/cobalt-factor-2 C20-methyltransferase